jgi:hypothetical protein
VVLLVVVAAAPVAPQGYSFFSSSSNPSSSTQQPGNTGTPSSKAQPNTERGSRTGSASSTTAAHATEPHGSNSSHGVWHEGGADATAEQLERGPKGYVPCEGPPLQCAVVHKQLVPEVRADKHHAATQGIRCWVLHMVCRGNADDVRTRMQLVPCV